MPVSVQNLIKERKFPFLFSLVVLLICVSVIFLTNDRYPYFNSLDLRESPSISSSPPELSSHPISSSTAHTPPPGIDHPSNAAASDDVMLNWEICKGLVATDYIPCLDNMKAIKALQSRRHMEHRERHCLKPSLRCLVPLPPRYRIPVPWPKSRDMIWFDNVPHPKLVEYKKDQNWVRKSGDYLVFPGGGTQFKDGVNSYISFIEKTIHTTETGYLETIDIPCYTASEVMAYDKW